MLFFSLVSDILNCPCKVISLNSNTVLVHHKNDNTIEKQK